MAHIIPKLSTPLNLPFLILMPSSGSAPPSWPPATRPPSNTTGTFCPDEPTGIFGAPVTIWTVSLPTFTWQITSLSASGCFSTDSICPTTILSRFLSKAVKFSTFVPESVIASLNSWSVTSSPGTIALIQFNDVFMIQYPFLVSNFFAVLQPSFFLELF